MTGVVQTSIVGLWCDAQKVAHQWINIYSLKGTNLQVFLEVWPHCPEKGLHVQTLIVKTMLALVELHGEVLQIKTDAGNCD